MNIQKNHSLQKHNTFKVDVSADYFCEVNSERELLEVLNTPDAKDKKIIILGDGANILFTQDWNGLVIYMHIKGIKVVEENAKHVLLEIGAGENWSDLVEHVVENNWGGIENLILIPGTVGGAAVQNIAAYGQNLQDVFESLDAINLSTKEQKVFKKADCEFTYRDSYFKTKHKGEWAVTKVILRLSKEAQINTSYFETGRSYAEKVSVQKELERHSKPPYTIQDVSSAVASIRSQKFPDVTKVGTAGSFFKNPIITRKRYEELLKGDPELQCYPVNALTYPKLDDATLTHEDYVKIPAGRLLDKLGWRGKRIGNAGVHDHHALVVVNAGGATADEIVKVYKGMQKDIKDHYGIDLEPEVQII